MGDGWQSRIDETLHAVVKRKAAKERLRPDADVKLPVMASDTDTTAPGGPRRQDC
jgi:hypothetical protein